MPEKYTKVEDRHLFRGLRHTLADATPEQAEKYSRESSAHLRDDASDHIAAQTEASKEKKDGLEGLRS